MIVRLCNPRLPRKSLNRYLQHLMTQWPPWRLADHHVLCPPSPVDPSSLPPSPGVDFRSVAQSGCVPRRHVAPWRCRCRTRRAGVDPCHRSVPGDPSRRPDPLAGTAPRPGWSLRLTWHAAADRSPDPPAGQRGASEPAPAPSVHPLIWRHRLDRLTEM
jgi:hypothetical protein